MEIEVTDRPVPGRLNNKFSAINVEIMETLLKIPNGKSIRIAHETLKEARGHMSSIKKWIKDRKLQNSYFCSAPLKPEGIKFYLWIGHKGE